MWKHALLILLLTGYIQMSGYNPESNIEMASGYNHWVMFALPSSYVAMLSIPHLDTPVFGNPPKSSVRLYQERGQSAEESGNLRVKGASKKCMNLLGPERDDFQFFQVTVNRSYITTDDLTYRSTQGLAMTTRKQRGEFRECGRFVLTWNDGGQIIPEPVVSNSNMWLHAISVLDPNTLSYYYEGFRLIFTFHLVRKQHCQSSNK